MFSQTMDYALRAVAYLASNPPRHCASKQIRELRQTLTLNPF